MMKRFLAFVLAFLIILCTFSACGASKSDETEKPGEEQQDEDPKNEEAPEKPEETQESTDPSAEGDGSESSSGDGDGEKTPEKTPADYYTRDGKKIKFGSYPQTQVTDQALISKLDLMAGTLPTGAESQKWVSYGYYTGGNNDNDFMWYIDVVEGSEKYRGVYFTSYRPYVTSYGPTSNDAKEGFDTGKAYWFKYEPLTWTILSEDETEGTALILCDMIIDSQAYQNDYMSGSGNNIISGMDEETYVNSYECSTIRGWLNAEFFNTAFSPSEQAIVRDTTVDNSGATTHSATNPYASKNTDDKVFLLSYQDVLKKEYGFSDNNVAGDAARVKKFTDYARVQGIYEFSDETYAGKSQWWLRSPSDTSPINSCLVTYTGSANNTQNVNTTTYGVVPAIRLRLK